MGRRVIEEGEDKDAKRGYRAVVGLVGGTNPSGREVSGVMRYTGWHVRCDVMV